MQYLPFLVSGLGIGAVYALSGLGLAVLYRASGTINFAFGALGAFAAHVMWQLMQFGAPEVVAAFAGIMVAAAVALTYGALITPFLKNCSNVVRSVATLGLTLVVLGAMDLAWGETPRRLTLGTDGFSIGLSGARLNGTRLAALAMTAVGVVGIGVFLATTRLGLSMRAVSNSRDLSEILGVDTRRVDATAWIISGALAGAAGIFLANIVRLQPTFLTFLVIPGIAAAIVGRLVSLPGAAVGGLLIGLLEAVLAAFPSLAPYRSATPYVVAVLFIALSPPSAFSGASNDNA